MVGVSGTRILCLFAVWLVSKPAIVSAFDCPKKIGPYMCDTLNIRQDGDWDLYGIYLFDSPYVDTAWKSACEKTRDSCTVQRDPRIDSLNAIYWTECAQRLFGTYDLRWPDDREHRAPVPTADGRQDAISFRFHVPGDAYTVYVTKRDILALALEPFVGIIEFQAIQFPVFLRSLKKPSLGSGILSMPFNIKGQRIPSPQVPAFLVPGPPGKPGK